MLPFRVWNRLRRFRALQRAFVPFGCDLKPDRWIFIIGCYNSGTTLLNAILSTHHQLSGLECEGVALTDALPRPEEYGWTRMWCRCFDQMRLEPGPGMEERARRVKRQWSFSYPRNATCLLEKSIANTARIPFLDAYFQPAYFIYLVRDGYAVAEGIQRKANPARWNHPVYEDLYPIELCAEQWKVTDEVVKQDREVVERFLRVHYEDLASNPKSTIRRITDFLGIEPIDDSKLKKKWGVHGYERPIQNMNPRSYARLSSEDMETIEKTAGVLLRKYGYERPEVIAEGKGDGPSEK
ncbi:sulfotransferase family protein [Salinibacter ruber]|uniref:Sulfotransferase n=1 Tax=Salinibacter ruber TaxID=146919 RepID=A0A9X2RF71_9BACT|nr:sulfotransferase [Salinibacter ruber]MCS3864621.1 hypothetical protein [Salinibacter ruber]